MDAMGKETGLLVLRGFNLMEINVATAVFQVRLNSQLGK